MVGSERRPLEILGQRTEILGAAVADDVLVFDADAAGLAEDRSEPPFVLIEPLRRTAPLLFASPHSGRRYPADLLALSRLDALTLRRSEDCYVDELFFDLSDRMTPHNGPIPRYV